MHKNSNEQQGNEQKISERNFLLGTSNGVKVSIIIRSYNAQDTIKRAIQSALKQTMPRRDYEIVLINDGSTDATESILREFSGENRMRIITQTNQGGTAAANKALAQSRGEYIILLDDDDYFFPSCIKELSLYLDAHPNIDFVYPDYYEQREGKRMLISPRHLFEALDGGVMFRKDKLIQEGGYSLNVIFAGYDLFLRTLGRWKGAHVKKPLYVYTRNSQSNTANAAFVKKGIEQLKTRFPNKLDIINTIRSYETN